jgi:hypothetical protein
LQSANEWARKRRKKWSIANYEDHKPFFLWAVCVSERERERKSQAALDERKFICWQYPARSFTFKWTQIDAINPFIIMCSFLTHFFNRTQEWALPHKQRRRLVKSIFRSLHFLPSLALSLSVTQCWVKYFCWILKASCRNDVQDDDNDVSKKLCLQCSSHFYVPYRNGRWWYIPRGVYSGYTLLLKLIFSIILCLSHSLVRDNEEGMAIEICAKWLEIPIVVKREGEKRIGISVRHHRLWTLSSESCRQMW